jgi:hypothetical protein
VQHTTVNADQAVVATSNATDPAFRGEARGVRTLQAVFVVRVHCRTRFQYRRALPLEGELDLARQCPLLGVKRTSRRPSGISIYGFLKSSGSWTMFAAIRRASSFVSSLAADPIGFCYYCSLERGGLSGSKVMEWFKRKTTIAGYQIPNWIIVLGAIIIVLLIFQNSH